MFDIKGLSKYFRWRSSISVNINIFPQTGHDRSVKGLVWLEILATDIWLHQNLADGKTSVALTDLLLPK